ncbi:MAG: aspartate--tRNA(Asn) ligase [Alphaproteobacteria bacterium]|nr:aspartate--tRNA(Asn) ligase [Alphaproteobacteria bacterium]
MLNRVHIKDIVSEDGKQILIKSSIQTIREQGKIVFLILRDISGICQAIVKEGSSEFDCAKRLTIESAVEISGIVKTTKNTEKGYEILVEGIKILNESATPLPIPVVEKGDIVTTEKRQDNRFLIWRREKESLILKIVSQLDSSYRNFLLGENFIEIHTPKLMPSPSESSAELFELEYFDRTAYLAQSPQLYKQMAISSGLERVFEVGPVFRAEKSQTNRHATEFVSYDVEMGYIDNFEEVLVMLENLVKSILESINERYSEEIKLHYGVENFTFSSKIPRLTMAEAKSILKERGLDISDDDLSTAEEKAIGDYVKEKYDHDFVFITDYPTSCRPFYHKRKNDDITASSDLIYKGVEIVTTAQREENYETLLEQLNDKGLEQKPMQWYLDFFKYGCPPHGGWGFGASRLIMNLLGLESLD